MSVKDTWSAYSLGIKARPGRIGQCNRDSEDEARRIRLVSECGATVRYLPVAGFRRSTLFSRHQFPPTTPSRIRAEIPSPLHRTQTETSMPKTRLSLSAQVRDLRKSADDSCVFAREVFLALPLPRFAGVTLMRILISSFRIGGLRANRPPTEHPLPAIRLTDPGQDSPP